MADAGAAAADKEGEKPAADAAAGTVAAAPAAPQHKLQTSWCFWYDKKHKKGGTGDYNEYKANLHKVHTFSTVEDFWRLYTHIKRPSALENNINMYFFRDAPNSSPSWESFPNGGCWILKIKKRAHSGTSVLGKMWQDLVFAAIGECFEEPTVVGVGMAVRSKEDLLSVWNSDNSGNDAVRFAIGEKLKAILDLEPSTMIEYKHFASSMEDMSTYRHAKPYVFAAAQAVN
ncbi:putative eukaryotic initiation factor 4E [Tribonema minus]|uniref:Putative eukaryotic initiation factor 4E n=1 Tax=Tribonema minus TaxID=303371 RepID=A0A836CBD6_9STRA|nr:putative eukaryotic initiation factor 4E [Tribonema minus]